MRLSIVAKPATKERLEVVRQIGAEDVVYYSVEDRGAILINLESLLNGRKLQIFEQQW